jgi:hypothetical protein
MAEGTIEAFWKGADDARAKAFADADALERDGNITSANSVRLSAYVSTLTKDAPPEQIAEAERLAKATGRMGALRLSPDRSAH